MVGGRILHVGMDISYDLLSYDSKSRRNRPNLHSFPISESGTVDYRSNRNYVLPDTDRKVGLVGNVKWQSSHLIVISELPRPCF